MIPAHARAAQASAKRAARARAKEGRTDLASAGAADDADELAALKGQICILNAALATGWAIDKDRTSENSASLRSPDNARIVVKLEGGRGTGYFNPLIHHDAGSALDFVQIDHRTGARVLTLGQARQELRRLAGMGKPENPSMVTRTKAAGRVVDPDSVARTWAGLLPATMGALAYLKSRGVAADTIAAAGDSVRTDSRGNACLAHRSANGHITGWEIKGRRSGPRGARFSTGGDKTLFTVGIGASDPQVISVTESAIDAMSWAQIDGGLEAHLYVSTAGSFGPPTIAAMKALAEGHPAARWRLGFDNDDQGKRFAAVAAEALADLGIIPEIVWPSAKDWNDQLKGAAP